MKLQRLIMQAFGPYTERIELDFKKGLAGSTFFLIHGMTGAGKTTILDAISFALYGRASGSLRTGTMLRAGNAKPEMETEVELTFSLGTRTYHVLRRPKYQREDRKSATPARAELYDVQADGSKKLIVSGFSDVTERIEVLTGFHCEEFRQVMLLPQGEFRTFLMADSKKRGELMRVLFHTEQYARIEQKLKERAGSIEAQNEKNLEEQKRIFAQAGVEDEKGLARQKAADEDVLAKLQNLLKELEAKNGAAQKQLSEAMALEQSFVRLEQAEAAIREDAKKQPDVEAYRKKLERAKQAAALLDKEALAKAGRKGAEAAEAAAKQSSEAFTRAETAALAARTAWEQAQENGEAREAAKRRAQELSEAQQSVRALAELQKQAEAAAKREAEAKTASQKSEAKAEAAKKKAERLRLLERAGKAFALAQGLEDGKPCPVCGATEHPHPAATEDIVPTEAEVRRAEEALARAERTQSNQQDAASAAAAESAALAGKLAAARENLPDGLPKDAQGKVSLTAVMAASQEAAKQAKALETAFEQARQADQTAQTTLSAARAKAESSAVYAAELRKKAEADAAAFEKARTAAGFADAAAYEAAIAGKWREAAFQQQVEMHIREFEDAKLVHENQRKDAAAQTAGKERPDIAALQAAAKVAAAAWQQAVGKEKTAELCLAQEEKMLKELEKLRKTQAALESEARVVLRLSQVANAEAPYRIHFQTYIQRSIFRDVMAAANERLTLMSAGRYALELGSQSDGRKADGLEIAVYDAYTGKARETQSLSGGESFLASLSLALGLADVVERYAGGIHLDTMFIDEGFGSLDSETLDMAIEALMKLQAGGRVVGIISHVEELAARIPDRLEITKGATGSTAQFVHGTLSE